MKPDRFGTQWFLKDKGKESDDARHGCRTDAPADARIDDRGPPLLIAAAGLSFLLSLVQTLTSVPRLAAIAMILLVGMPWFLERVANYMRFLMGDFRRFLG